ncbi:MAG: uracil-DNA glycosylase [Clostridia bacterium]|nr:uracil-DNA glycosylase [Clostridia bacterium]
MTMTWEELKARCEACEDCALYRTRQRNVFGVGNEKATLLFVGEAPGADEDLSGIPFVGKAGQLFDQFLSAVDIDRDQVYIANILKCRPPRNRDPEPSEQEACFAHLREQIRLIKPKLIVCLGRIAAMRLIREDYRITKEHGSWVKKGEFEITAVYHPSALLRDVEKREAMLADMTVIAKKWKSLAQELP